MRQRKYLLAETKHDELNGVSGTFTIGYETEVLNQKIERRVK